MVLQSEALSAEVRADEGGRVSSLVCARSGTEFLTPAREHRQAVAPGMTARFQDGPCAGIEDCLPTVGACGEETEGGAVPDHGDFWQVPWSVIELGETAVRLEARGFSRPLRLRKQIRVDGRTLRLGYEVENEGPEPTSLLYAAHPLLTIAEGDRVVLPQSVREMTVTYARGAVLERWRGRVGWPGASGKDGVVDLSVTGAISAGAAAMLYSDRLEQGVCGLYRSRKQQGILLRFDTARLPYLGVWLCYGGWPDDGDGVPQYAVALEPTTAPCNRLAEAQQKGLAMRLAPGACAAWQLAFEVARPGQSYAEFVQAVG